MKNKDLKIIVRDKFFAAVLEDGWTLEGASEVSLIHKGFTMVLINRDDPLINIIWKI